jgi:DNA-binding transcriptional LysR family regulator
VTTEKIARFFSKPFDLQVIELPLKLPPIPVFLIWHRSRERDPGHSWMRAGIRKIIEQSVI